MRTVRLLPALLLLAFLPVPNAAATGPAFYEVPLVLDEPEDYPVAAFDLAGLYISELFPYDFDSGLAVDQVVIRVEPRSLSDANQCMVQAGDVSATACTLRYDVHFRAGATDHSFFVNFRAPGAGVCCDIIASDANVSFNQTSVLFLLGRADLGLTPGSQIERLFATSDIVEGDQREPADRVPGDNEQLPRDQKPELDELFADPYTLRGTFDFFTVEPLTPTVRPTLGGDAAEFDFRITSSPGVQDDTIRIKFERPAGWSIIPSRGTAGPDPTGLITGLSAGMSAEFGFKASPNNIVEVGDMIPIGMNAYSSSQGHEYLPLVVRITNVGYDDTNHVFRLADSGPFRAGELTTIRFDVLDADQAPLTDLEVDGTFFRDGRRVALVPAARVGDHYEVQYAFPSPGTWTIELLLHGPAPTPHGVFTVNVEGASGAPGPGLLPALLVVAALAFVRRP